MAMAIILPSSISHLYYCMHTVASYPLCSLSPHHCYHSRCHVVNALSEHDFVLKVCLCIVCVEDISPDSIISSCPRE